MRIKGTYRYLTQAEKDRYATEQAETKRQLTQAWKDLQDLRAKIEANKAARAARNAQSQE